MCRCGFPDPGTDQTSIITAPTLPGAMPQPAVPVVIDTAKKSLVGGAEVTLSAKEWLLLNWYKHRNELVTYDSIRMTVWAERVSSAGRPPEVGVEEINLLRTDCAATGRCEYPQNPPRPGPLLENRLDANIVFGVFLFVMKL